MLTLLLSLFIVLFAMSDIDKTKFKEMTNTFNLMLGSKGIQENRPPSPVLVCNNTERDEMKGLVDSANDLKTLQKQINRYINLHNLQGKLHTKLTKEALHIVILNDILFDSGSDLIKPESRRMAKQISNLLDTNPQRERHLVHY